MDANRKDPSIEELIDGAMEEAPQALIASPAPIARTDELLRAIQGPALRAVLDARIEQIVTHGHDAESDAFLAIDRLPRLAREQAQMALEVLGHDERRNIPVAKRRLARAAAMMMAAIDRLDMIKEGAGQ